MNDKPNPSVCPGESCAYTGKHEHDRTGLIVIKDDALYDALAAALEEERHE